MWNSPPFLPFLSGSAHILFPLCYRPAPRQLNDEELDSGDDEDRYDRMGDPMDYDQGDGVDYGGTLNVMDLDLGRVPEPESKDGEVSRDCVAIRLISVG